MSEQGQGKERRNCCQALFAAELEKGTCVAHFHISGCQIALYQKKGKEGDDAFNPSSRLW